MSFKGEQQKIRHNGSKKKEILNVHIHAMALPKQNLLYDFYDTSNSTNAINHLENLKIHVIQNGWKRIVLVWNMHHII